jgi:hypothetical protein
LEGPQFPVTSQTSFFPAGLPLEILQSDFWVPGNTSRAESARYATKQQFQEILQTTEDSALMWAMRATKDFGIETIIFGNK